MFERDGGDPADIAVFVDRLRADRLRPDYGPDTVRADQHLARVCPAVRAQDRDAVTGAVVPYDFGTVVDRSIGQRAPQQSCQIAAAQVDDRGTEFVGYRCDRQFSDQFAARSTKMKLRTDASYTGLRQIDAERTEHLGGVAGDSQSAAGGPRSRRGIEHLDVETSQAQSNRGRQAAHTRVDHYGPSSRHLLTPTPAGTRTAWSHVEN